MGAEVKIVKPRSCNHPCLDKFHCDVHMIHLKSWFQCKILTRLHYFSELEIGKIFKRPGLRSKEL